uniref:Uncharacterized protein n=1 Tax=Nelumbo nucifera TaxID=4432 RepID=A0A822ZST4_NELNU|nr:TPA_asm: hypothetical protein HUJ06_003148 [Nelumbo nucifera]
MQRTKICTNYKLVQMLLKCKQKAKEDRVEVVENDLEMLISHKA